MTASEGSHQPVSGSVPLAFSQRKRLWVYSSLWLNHVDCPYASLSVQTLGYAERLLLEMEAKLAALVSDTKAKKQRDLLLSECSAHSVLWVFGLYEILRTVRESSAAQFAGLEAFWNTETGQVGWQIFNPRLGTMEVLSRTPLANEFLSITAVPPEHMTPFAIGGPLGEFDD